MFAEIISMLTGSLRQRKKNTSLILKCIVKSEEEKLFSPFRLKLTQVILFFCFCYLLFLFRFCSFRGALLPIWSLVVIGSLEQFEKVEAYISFSFFVVNDKVPGVSSNNKPLIH